jgi:hypothetical protein
VKQKDTFFGKHPLGVLLFKGNKKNKYAPKCNDGLH